MSLKDITQKLETTYRPRDDRRGETGDRIDMALNDYKVPIQCKVNEGEWVAWVRNATRESITLGRRALCNRESPTYPDDVVWVAAPIWTGKSFFCKKLNMGVIIDVDEAIDWNTRPPAAAECGRADAEWYCLAARKVVSSARSSSPARGCVPSSVGGVRPMPHISAATSTCQTRLRGR